MSNLRNNIWNYNQGQIILLQTYNYICFLFQLRYEDDDDADGPAPDPALEYGMPLPIRLAAEFPPELVATPIEDIDVFYQNKKVCSGRYSEDLFFV